MPLTGQCSWVQYSYSESDLLLVRLRRRVPRSGARVACAQLVSQHCRSYIACIRAPQLGAPLLSCRHPHFQMMTSDGQPAFRPMQALPPAQAREIVRAFYSQATGIIVAYTLQSLLPPLPPSSVIHDNSCGDGAVTAAILRTRPAVVTVHATDADPAMVAAVRNLAFARSWPVQTALSAAEALPYPADFFSRSISAFVLPHTARGGPDAARELHRTLRPGGSAVVCDWAVVPTIIAINAARAVTGAAELPPPPQSTAAQVSAETLRQLLTQAGFDDSRLTLQTRAVEMEIRELQHWAQALWSTQGASSAGWTRGDEQRWDEAVAVLVCEIRESDRFTAADAGGGHLRFDVNIAIAVK